MLHRKYWTLPASRLGFDGIAKSASLQNQCVMRPIHWTLPGHTNNRIKYFLANPLKSSSTTAPNVP